MKLYASLTSPYARHCRIALAQANINVILINTDQTQSAELSATQRVPFLRGDNISLTDSASIIRFARETSGQPFLPDVEDLDKFCFINTILDSAANIFYLEKFGLNIGDNMYIQRQQSRVDKSLTQLERTPEGLIPFNPSSDWHLRLACLVDWAIFRHRIEIKTYPRLATFLDAALSHNEFAQTRPTE